MSDHPVPTTPLSRLALTKRLVSIENRLRTIAATLDEIESYLEKR